MLRDRRVLVVLLVAALIGVPAAILGAMCAGNACRRAEPPGGRTPFCSLPQPTRAALGSGFREGRSPDVLAVTGATSVAGATDVPGALWPSAEPDDSGRVPLAFAGTGIEPAAEIPAGTTLDALAPTLAEVVGLRRPHPGVRSGTSVEGVAAAGSPRLVVVVVWKGIAATDLERAPTRWPVLRGLIEDGAGTLDAEVGSRPLDPAAVLTTVGTGGLPRDHGITGTHVRDDDGAVVSAWSEEAPFSVIAGLGDDLDELLDERPRIGLVGTESADRGVIGGTWYVDHDRDDVVITRNRATQLRSIAELLVSGYGTDEIPDLLAVVMDGPVAEVDTALGEVVALAGRASGGSMAVALTSTGAMAPNDAYPATSVERRVEDPFGADVVDTLAAGGLFLDQDVLSTSGVTDDRIVATLRRLDEDGRPLFADAFPALAVTFARYC